MPRGFGRLPFLARRGAATAQSRPDASAGFHRQIDDDDAPVGPPVLLPATIHRMILVDRTELTPIWARPRLPQPVETAGPATPDGSATTTGPAQPEPAASREELPAPRPARKRKATGGPSAPKPTPAPRSPRKPAGNRRRTP